MLAGEVERAVGRHLDAVDRVLPRQVEGLYLVGSTAMGGFRLGRSDIDFVAVLAGELGGRQLDQLRRVQLQLYLRSLAGAVSRPPWRWPLVCNGVYVLWHDLAHSPLGVKPIAAHVAGRFTPGGGFDANPVTWRTLATKGIAVRGPRPSDLRIHHDDQELRRWTLDNLNRYWRRWAVAVRRPGWAAVRASIRHLSDAWGVLGAPRLHFTLATGEIASKGRALVHETQGVWKEGTASWTLDVQISSAKGDSYRNQADWK